MTPVWSCVGNQNRTELEIESFEISSPVGWVCRNMIKRQLASKLSRGSSRLRKKTPANHVESPIFYWLGITLPKMADGMSPIRGVWTGISPTICSRSCISFARNSDIPKTRVSRMKCSGSGNSAGLVYRAHTNVNNRFQFQTR